MATMASTNVITTPLRGTIARDAALVAVATAFISLSAQVSVRLPFSPVPITGQTFAVLMAGAALGSTLALSSTGLYFALAVAGLPVLTPTSEDTHVTGIAVFSMPSLGYVVGFMIAAVVVGRLAERGFTRTPARTIAAMVVGNVVIYASGLAWLHQALAASWSDTVAWGMTPFLVGDAIKIAIAAGLLPATWRALKR